MEASNAVRSIPDWFWLVLVALVALAAYLLVVWMPRISGAPASNLASYQGLLSLNPVASADDSPLCNFYIATAYDPAFGTGSIYNKLSAENIVQTLAAGARCLHFNVYAGADNQPVLAAVNAAWDFRVSLNSLPLSNALDAVAANAFNPIIVGNNHDPLLLSFKVHSNDNQVNAAVAAIIKQSLGAYLLGPDFGHQNKNVAQTPINLLRDKCVILSGDTHAGNEFDELVNLSWTGPYLRLQTHKLAEETYDATELTNFNRQHVSLTIPDPDATENTAPTALHEFGVQCVAMRYGSLDKAMEQYIEKFQDGSFILKPPELLYTRPSYPTPVIQDPKKYFTPLEKTTPIYTARI